VECSAWQLSNAPGMSFAHNCFALLRVLSGHASFKTHPRESCEISAMVTFRLRA